MHESQNIILNYLAVKQLCALLRGVTSKAFGYFYCLNCCSHIVQERNFKKKIIYADLEPLLERIDTCHNDP